MPSEQDDADTVRPRHPGKKPLSPIEVREDEAADAAQDLAGDDEFVVDVKDESRAPGAGSRGESARVVHGDDDEEQDDDEGDEPAAAGSQANAGPPPEPHDARTVSLARQLGLTAEEIAACTPGELRAAVTVAARLSGRAAPEPAARKEPAPEPEYDLGLTEAELDVLDPDVAKLLKKAVGKIARESGETVKALKAQMEQDRQAREDEKRSALNARIVRAFTAVDRADLFGATGRETKEQMARRQAVCSLAGTLEGTVAQRIKAAVATLYPGEGEKGGGKGKGKAPRRERAWARGALAAPRGRREAPAKTPEDRLKRAKRVAEEKFGAGAAGRNGDIHGGDDARV